MTLDARVDGGSNRWRRPMRRVVREPGIANCIPDGQGAISLLTGIASHQKSLKRTLLFGSVGDYTDAVDSWFGTEGCRDHHVAIVYYGDSPDGPWARHLRQSADIFAVRKGGKFQNLLFLTQQHEQLLNQYAHVLVADDDIRVTPGSLERMVRTANEFDLAVSSAAHAWHGRRSSWPHMMARAAGRRSSEPAAGVELCNFVEMTCPLFETSALRKFLDMFRPVADRLLGFGADWLISSACFTEERPFGVMHNCSIVNAISRPGLPPKQREINRVENEESRRRGWLAVAAECRPRFNSKGQIRTWLPMPRMRCINLERAVERRERFTQDWIVDLGFPIRFHCAIDRRDIENRSIFIPHKQEAARKIIGRNMTYGELACVASHVQVIQELMEYCGPEGVFVFEDDCRPIARIDAENLVSRVHAAVTSLPGTEIIACHKPLDRVLVRTQVEGVVRPETPPWGSILTWYSPRGLKQTYTLLARFDRPADWGWRDRSLREQFALLNPPVASHEQSDTTYIGNKHRGRRRRFIV